LIQLGIRLFVCRNILQDIFHINQGELLSAGCEYTSHKQYQSEVEAKAKEAEALYKEYQKASASLSAAQKTQREEAIVAKEKEAAELRKKYFGPEGEMAKKQEALITPIQDKIYEAVKQISEQKGYAAVVDRGSAQSIIFASPSIDISNEVLSRLGYSN
jgi:outer membrane protein